MVLFHEHPNSVAHVENEFVRHMPVLIAVPLMPTLCTQMVTRFVTSVTTARTVMARHPITITQCQMSNSKVPLPGWLHERLVKRRRAVQNLQGWTSSTPLLL